MNRNRCSIVKTTISSSIARRRVETAATARNQFISYYFFLGELKYRVCKQFYTDTLNIGKTRIEYHCDQLKDTVTEHSINVEVGKNIQKRDLVTIALNML